MGKWGQEMDKDVVQSPHKLSDRLFYRKYERRRSFNGQREASVHAKHKLKPNVGKNEASLKNGVCYEPIDYE